VLKHARALDALTDAVMQGADNDVARQMTAVLRARITYLRTITTRAATQTRRRDTVDILKSIVEALKARRADEAEKQWRAYVERSASFAREILLSLQNSEQQNEKTGNR